MSIEFRERATLEHVFQLEVRKCGALVGHVRRNPRGTFQYYRGPLNQLMYEFEDDDLDRIKKRVATREGDRECQPHNLMQERPSAAV
jgi:hypothetical protein